MSALANLATVVLDRTGKLIAIIGFTTLCVILIFLTWNQKYDWLQYGLLVLSHFMSLLIGHVFRLEAPGAPPPTTPSLPKPPTQT